MTTDLAAERRAFHAKVCERLLVLDGDVASNADGSQAASIQIGRTIAEMLGAVPGKKLPGQTAGQVFEQAVEQFLRRSFADGMSRIRPGTWAVDCINSRSQLVIARYEQYSHLAEIKQIAEDHPDLAVAIGLDYAVASDIVVARQPLDDSEIEAGGVSLSGDVANYSTLRRRDGAKPLMHASISCKWTIRSDRAQNSRFEALNLIRSRKGRVPHIVVVTAEPTPSRLSSLALGTGDMDCVYHFALPELITGVQSLGQSEAENLLSMMIEGKRLKDISDLPLDLAI